MWNLLMDELLETLEHNLIQHVAYADDLLLVIHGQSRMALETTAAAALQHVSNWGRRVGVEVALGKTNTMMLRGNFHIERPPIIQINGVRLQNVQAAKYLGVWVTPGFSFNLHMQETADKLKSVIAPLKRVLRKDWGLRRNTASKWLTGLMAPIVMYGAAVWYDSIVKHSTPSSGCAGRCLQWPCRFSRTARRGTLCA